MVLDEPTRGADMDTNFRDPAGQGDLDRLMALARHLVEFRKVDVLSNKQVGETIDLYNHLADADKARLKYPARQRPFSVKWGYGSRAQSPSLSRLVEGMISLLTDLYLAEERTRVGRKDRWPGVLLDYERIRRLVLSNRELVRHTMIQLFEVHTQTLRQW
ncbi:epithelial-stromal interaction protein 1 [Elysia marginata]|uniref:Epithelial-stromal interaction protein 1 n=1 Tax=Elysia marginata TaxID=1093978 RepID=A0AAV4JMB6_9GAST|nr:epithelial-stromal interaction protein 1 [Elysia marginata]